MLSCSNEDMGKLVVDEEAFCECLAKVRAEKQLVIVVSHHPIGAEKTTKERWLASWNSERLEQLLLQTTGPHIYFHGHLHDQNGTTISLSTGQSLAFFGAGAAYQNSPHPMRFAFYQIDLLRSNITPHVYSFNPATGQWHPDPPLSVPFLAALPRPPGVRVTEAPAKVIALKAVLTDLMQHHVAIRKILAKEIPELHQSSIVF